MRDRLQNLIFVLLLTIPALGIAQVEPVIENIIGEISHGAEIQVTGQSFGSKPQASPRYWADFESGINPNDLGLSQVWDQIVGNLTGDNTRTRSSGALRSDVSTAGGGGPVVRDMNSDNWYMFFKRYYAFDIETNLGPIGFNLKINRMWPEIIGGEIPYGNNIHINYQGNEPRGNGRVTNENTSIDGTLWFRDIAPFVPNQWHTEEIIYKTGQINVQDGVFNWIRNGIPVWTGRLWQMRTSERPNRYKQLFFDQVSNGTGPGPLWIYYDDIYMDDTWARVMACNKSIWKMCQKKEIQIPISWDNNQIDIVINFGDFDILNESIYLFVITESGQVNPKGMLISQCSNCPNSPTDLDSL